VDAGWCQAFQQFGAERNCRGDDSRLLGVATSEREACLGEEVRGRAEAGVAVGVD
jgi:hypothetical protein